METLHNIRLLLLGAWVGAAVFFSAVVAPNAFRVLRSYSLTNASEIAGSIVSRTLYVINVSGFIIGLLLLLTALALKQSYGRRAYLIQLVLLTIVTGTTAIGEWFIARKIRALRASASIPIDQLVSSDPVRVAFDALHGYSVAALSIAIIAALFAFFVLAKRVG
jgi:hypothetical protein